jgi:hypothetical protein
LIRDLYLILYLTTCMNFGKLGWSFEFGLEVTWI